MSETPVGKGKLKSLLSMPSTPRHSRIMASQVEIHLPPIHWTPDLIDQVASLLADALVRDLQQHPPETSRRAS